MLFIWPYNGHSVLMVVGSVEEPSAARPQMKVAAYLAG